MCGSRSSWHSSARAKVAWPAIPDDQSPVRRTSVSAEVGARPAAQEPRAHQASAWLAAHDRLAVSDVRTRNAHPDPLRRAVDRIACQRARRRDQGATSSSATARSSSKRPVPIHGTFTDTLAIDPAFLRRLESLFPGPRFSGGHRQAAQPRHVVHSSMAEARCSRST